MAAVPPHKPDMLMKNIIQVGQMDQFQFDLSSSRYGLRVFLWKILDSKYWVTLVPNSEYGQSEFGQSVLQF